MWTPQPPPVRDRSTTFQLAEGYAEHIRQDQNNIGMNIERGIDEVVMASLRASLSSLGKVFKAGLVDEGMPQSWQRHVARFNDTLWINFKEYVEEEVYEQRSLERKDHRRSLIASWATDRKCWQRGGGRLPDPLGWLRARILYSLCPADATIWQIGTTTSFWVVLVLTVLPFYGISIYTYVGLFLIIERTDEYQLVSFICRFKALQFLIQGALPAIATSVRHYICLDLPTGTETSAVVGCDAMPTPFVWELFAEPLRIGVVWLAFGLLACGHAHGGRAQLKALELRRIDAADGMLDGAMAASLSRRNKRRASVAADAANPTATEMATAHRAALRALGATQSSVRSGGLLPYFMAYDVVATLACLVVFGSIAAYRNLASRHNERGQPWLFWETVALAREVQALLSFPFLVFLLPSALPLLTHVQPTGYDKKGLLCQALTRTQIRLMRREKRARLNRHRNGASGGGSNGNSGGANGNGVGAGCGDGGGGVGDGGGGGGHKFSLVPDLAIPVLHPLIDATTIDGADDGSDGGGAAGGGFLPSAEAMGVSGRGACALNHLNQERVWSELL